MVTGLKKRTACRSEVLSGYAVWLSAFASLAACLRQAAQADGAWRTAQVALKELMVAEASDPIWSASIVPSDRPEVGSRAIDVPAAIARAVANRSDVQIARKQRESTTTNMRLLNEQTKPGVDLIAEYTTSSALRSTASPDSPGWSVGLNVTLPIGNTAAKASLARTQVQQRQVDVQLQALEVAIAAQVTRIAEQVRTAEEQIKAAAAARELAQRRRRRGVPRGCPPTSSCCRRSGISRPPRPTSCAPRSTIAPPSLTSTSYRKRPHDANLHPTAELVVPKPAVHRFASASV